MPSFQYEPLVLFPKLEILDEEKNRRDINGLGPLGTRIEEEPKNLKEGKDNPKREVVV
jgi:hypothetical protein